MNLVASILKRRAGEARQAARDLGLAAAGRPDHEDVLRQNLLLHRTFELLAAPAVAQRDRDRALGIVLADDEAVELGDDLARAERRCEGCGDDRLGHVGHVNLSGRETGR